MNGAREGTPPTGSLAEEALKLVQALQDWAKESGPEGGETATSRAGGRDCIYCPVCRAISALRAASPEVKQHLTIAGCSLLQAVEAYLATSGPLRPAPRDEGLVEHIGVRDDGWEDD